MVDNELLLCNFRRCRRPLDSVAWVTFCSHIFCPEDGRNLRQTPCECPACGAKLTLQSDILRVELDPTEQFKSMILAGLQPEVIMEVCHRGLAFWTYQINQERTYQQHVVKRLRERLQEIQSYYEQVVRGRDDQLAAVRRQLEGARRDHEKCKEQREVINERLAEKTRQYQRLQTLYDTLRKRAGPPTGVGWSPPSSSSSSSSQPHPDPRVPFRCAAAIGPTLYPPPSGHVSAGTDAAAAAAAAAVAGVAEVAGVGPRYQQCPNEFQETGGGGGPLPIHAAPLGPASAALAPTCSLALPPNPTGSTPSHQYHHHQNPPSGFIDQQVPLPARRAHGGVDPAGAAGALVPSTAVELRRGDSCEDFTFAPVTRRSIGTGNSRQK
ncbi:E3 ubiquitin-protein ligase CCNB1IP1-like isoform X1 [Penaeus indicus]|uniref:E3 ubiquitin-protein ligase CCNB1IP1-like isoform X1 n=1 Tax=Penaeus indicus TaxID=29960 RepID=UPI00300DA465